MLLPVDGITQLASQGRLTLQIGDIWLGTPPPLAEFPDAWFCRLDMHKPKISGRGGCLYLTRAGYAANRTALLDAYETSGTGRGDGLRDTFEEFAAEHFARVESSRDAAYRRHLRLAERFSQFVV